MTPIIRTTVFVGIALAMVALTAFNSGTNSTRADGPNPPIIDSGALTAPDNPVNGQTISVRFKPGVSSGAIAVLNRRQSARPVDRQLRSGLYRLNLPPGASLDAAVAAYRRSPLVTEASVTRIAQLFEHPNDTNYPYQWHLRSTPGGMWGDTAWDLATNRGQGVVVAVIDTGVAYEDFNGSLDGSPQSFKKAPDLAATTFVAPYDYFYNDPHPNDDHGHGTHVAGTIAQNTNNAYGVAGVAHRSSIMPLKVLDYTGNGFGDDIVEAIYHAVSNGADVINMSIGFPGTGAPDGERRRLHRDRRPERRARLRAHQGVVLVAAAGNDGGIVSCPAAHPHVISVGATRFDAQVTFYSNNGSALDISAPGGDPYVDQSGDGYSDGVLQETFCYDSSILLILNAYGNFCNVHKAGTSMASPHVAGAAALLLGENPGLTPGDVRCIPPDNRARRRPCRLGPELRLGRPRRRCRCRGITRRAGASADTIPRPRRAGELGGHSHVSEPHQPDLDRQRHRRNWIQGRTLDGRCQLRSDRHAARQFVGLHQHRSHRLDHLPLPRPRKQRSRAFFVLQHRLGHHPATSRGPVEPDRNSRLHQPH